MAVSLGLALYRLTAGPKGQPALHPTARPPGQLVWLHSPSTESRLALVELARQLIEDSGVHVLLTGPQTPAWGDGAPFQSLPPEDHPTPVRTFLDHWRPDVVILAEGELRPVLLDELTHRKLPALVVDGIAPHLPDHRRAWYPGILAQALDQVRAVLVRDGTAARAFAKARAPADRLHVLGPMEEPSAALDCNESDRVALAAALATRPVWLAIDVPAAEESMVIAAHREALKLAHRLILILAPEDPSRIPVLAARLETEESWNPAQRPADEEPVPETEVFLVDAGTEAGLWYRLAPVAYLGGGLSEGGCRRDPMEGAALGSALILGARDGRWSRPYTRLGRARAARLVASPADLTLALSDLLSPDRAARQAEAAWTLATDGCDATARVLAMILALLDGAPLPIQDAPALPAPAGPAT